jgi:hypothetical protein
MKKKVSATKGQRQRTRPDVRDLGSRNATAVTGGLLPAVKTGTSRATTSIQAVYLKLPGV